MTTEEFLKLINADPTDVKDSEDGSYKFIPISVMESRLDEIFEGAWSWDFDREGFGKGYAFGKGTITYLHPVYGQWIRKSGTAAVALTKEIIMDYPLLEAQTLLSAARKIGTCFGRNLNRDREDAPIRTIQLDKGNDEGDAILEAEKTTLRAFEYKEDAAEYLSKSAFSQHVILKAIVNSKTSKA